MRKFFFIAVACLLVTTSASAMEVVLQNDETIECERAWRDGNTIYVEINSANTIEFQVSDVVSPSFPNITSKQSMEPKKHQQKAVAPAGPLEITRPKTDARPVYIVEGKVVTFPEGMEEPPEDYQGAMKGRKPVAVIVVEGTVVGEVYAAQLKKSTRAEASEMAASPKSSDGLIKLKERRSMKKEGKNIEVVTLQLNVKSPFGSPWITHSLYFPQGKSSVTFMLVAGADRFKSLLPYLNAMLF